MMSEKNEKDSMMGSLEILANKIELLADVQSRGMEKTDKLTEAVTTLVAQSSHFEQLRAEDNHRMDKIDHSIQVLRQDLFAALEKQSERINSNTSRLDQAKPIIGILLVVFTGMIVAAFSS